MSHRVPADLFDGVNRPLPGTERPRALAPRAGAGGLPRLLALLPLLTLAALLATGARPVVGQEQETDPDRCAPKECARTIEAARAWQIGPALAGYGRVESGGHREGAAVWITERVAEALVQLLRTEGRLTEVEARSLRRRLRSGGAERYVVLWAPLRGEEANCAPDMYRRIYGRAVQGARLVAESPSGPVEIPVEEGPQERVALPDRSWARGLRDAWVLRFPRTDPAGRPLVTAQTKRVELRVPWTTRTAEIDFEMEKLPAETLDEL